MLAVDNAACNRGMPYAWKNPRQSSEDASAFRLRELGVGVTSRFR